MPGPCAWLLLLLLAGLLCGCGKSQFEFVVQDESGTPLEGVKITYFPDPDAGGETTVAGETDAQGSLIVSGKHLATGRQYYFEKECGRSFSGARFNPAACAITSGGSAGRYTFGLKDGRLRKPDLGRKIPGKKWPGRIVKLTCMLVDRETSSGVAPGSTALQGRRQSLTRILDLTTTPEAIVSINGRTFGRVPESGWLNDEFCPGDSAACFASTVTITISKEGFETLERQEALPEPLGTLQLVAPLQPGDARPDEPPDTTIPPDAVDLARVRVENRGFPQTCGPGGTDWPVVLVNNERTRVKASPASTDWKAYYDLLLKPGKSYRIAVECPEEGPAAGSWNPWDTAAGQPKWYSIRIPHGTDRIYFAVPAFEPGRNLDLIPARGGYWENFRKSRATRVTQGYSGN